MGAWCFWEITWVRDGCSSRSRESTELLPQENLSASVWKALQQDPMLLLSSARPCWGAVVVLSYPSTVPEQGPWSAATISDSKQGTREQHIQHHGSVDPMSFEAAMQHFALQSIMAVNWQSPMTPLCILVVQHSKERCETGRDFKKLL